MKQTGVVGPDHLASRTQSLRTVIFLTLIALASACHQRSKSEKFDPAAPVEVMVPEHGAYTGAFIDFGEAEEDVTLEGVEDFEAMVGKHQAIIASSSYWGEQDFPSKNLNVIWHHRSLPLVFWSPWDRPYEQNTGPDRFNLNSIIAGAWDKYIDDWADAAKAFAKPMIVVFANEMNGDWFPWSGSYYGGNRPANEEKTKWQGPETFKAAYRHVVDRVRARGPVTLSGCSIPITTRLRSIPGTSRLPIIPGLIMRIGWD